MIFIYHDAKIMGNAKKKKKKINDELKEISEIVLCKNVLSNCCT